MKKNIDEAVTIASSELHKIKREVAILSEAHEIATIKLNTAKLKAKRILKSIATLQERVWEENSDLIDFFSDVLTVPERE